MVDVAQLVYQAFNALMYGVSLVNNGSLVIAGGTFTNINTTYASHPYPLPFVWIAPGFAPNLGVKVTGGTYAPPAAYTVSLNANKTLNPAGLPSSATSAPYDPGFAVANPYLGNVGGGTYAPVINITNLPDILGAGLL
jgi:hypothetical protein